MITEESLKATLWQDVRDAADNDDTIAQAIMEIAISFKYLNRRLQLLESQSKLADCSVGQCPKCYSCNTWHSDIPCEDVCLACSNTW